MIFKKRLFQVLIVGFVTFSSLFGSYKKSLTRAARFINLKPFFPIEFGSTYIVDPTFVDPTFVDPTFVDPTLKKSSLSKTQQPYSKGMFTRSVPRLSNYYPGVLVPNYEPGVLVPVGWPASLPYLDSKIDTTILTKKPVKKFAIEIKEVNPIIGKGGFALEFIPKGSIIQEYTGLEKIVHHSDLSSLPYALTVGTIDLQTNTINWGVAGEYQLIIDAESCGNESRFFNHSKNPNACFNMETKIPGKVFVVALKDIYPGEEITVSYGDKYWEDKDQKPL